LEPPIAAKLTEKTPRRIKGEHAPPAFWPQMWATRRTLSCACAMKGNAAAARYRYECRTRGPQVDFLGATDAHAHRRESIPCR